MAASGGSRRASARRGGAIYGSGGSGGAGPLLRTGGLILIVIVGLILIAKNCTGDGTSEANLQAEVEALFVIQEIEGVDVVVTDGTATLSGEVPTEAIKINAEGFAQSVNGVDLVENNIVVVAPDPGTGGTGELGSTLASLVTASPIKFASGSAEIGEASKITLNQVAQAINASPGSIITITGYTDNTGSEAGNLAISTERAEAVRSYLITQSVDGTLLSPVGKGQENPIASNETEEGREQNRRIEFTVS